MTNPNLGGREVTNDSRLREVALIIADDLIGICETATKVAHRTGNTFVIDRQRTASMIQGRIASLNKSNLNEHQPHAGRLLPCPFCGAQPQWKGAFPENRLECSQCLQATIKANWYGGDLGTVEACWNTRANAETRPSESGECQPPAVFSDPVEFNEYAIPNSERTLPATPLLRCEPVSERALSDRQIGKRLGVRDAITCLHDRAKEMNDPQAKAVLDSAAFNLGVDQSQGRISKAVNDALTRAEES